MGRGPNSRTGCTYIFFLYMGVEYIKCINIERVAMQFIAIRHNSFQGQHMKSMYMKTNSEHFLLQVFHPTGQHIYAASKLLDSSSTPKHRIVKTWTALPQNLDKCSTLEAPNQLDSSWTHMYSQPAAFQFSQMHLDNSSSRPACN
jgi:hypothetical protein